MNQNTKGTSIQIANGILSVPDDPIIPYIEGDGSAPDIWQAAMPVFNAAVEKAYAGKRRVSWLPVLGGEKAFAKFGTYLPDETLLAFRQHKVGMKGPLATPIGRGFRSVTVALRKALDLYVCQRPARWFPGVPSPVRNPQLVDMVVFRENTEDIYSGIEFEKGSEKNKHFLALLQEHFPEEYAKIQFPETAGIGLKNISETGSKRLARAALRYALEQKRRSVTFVHKGNIMKFTEGAFRNWGYEVAEQEFGDRVYTLQQWEQARQAHGEEAANQEMKEALASGRLLVKDAITDATLEMTITRPQEFDVLATTNLNGDYLSDALAAQVGGLGIAPGANINYSSGEAIFEATHGTAPKLAGLNKVNPCSLILSGEMMFRYLGWDEAADGILRGVEAAIAAGMVTEDLSSMTEGTKPLTTTQFGSAIIERMG